MNIRINGEIAEVTAKARNLKNALDTFALYVTQPGMEDKLMGIRRQVEEMQKQILADLEEEARS
jgi:hypothetical protein